MASPLSPTRAVVLATKDPDQSFMTSTLPASPNMVAGGYSTSLDAPLQAAPTLPFGVQAIPNPSPQPIIHIDEDRNPAYIAWDNAKKMEDETRLSPSSPARTLGATPQVTEALPCLITSAQLLHCANEKALLAAAPNSCEDKLEGQCSSAQRARPTPTLQTSGPHSTPFAASPVYTSQEAWLSQWDEAVTGLFTIGDCTIGNAAGDLAQHLISDKDPTRESPIATGAHIGYSTILDSASGLQPSGIGLHLSLIHI